MIKYLFIVLLVLMFSACNSDTAGGGASAYDGTSTETTTSTDSTRSEVYIIEVQDDAVIDTTVEALGCDKSTPIEGADGKYSLNCSKEPTVYVASGGYYKLDGDNEEHSVDMPLMLNISVAKKLGIDKPVVTPASTLVANLTDTAKIEEFANALGLNTTDLFSAPTAESQEVFRYLNLVNTIAIENGVRNIDDFTTYVRKSIVTTYNNNQGADPLTNIKNAVKSLGDNNETVKSFGFSFNGFMDELDEVDPSNLASSMSGYVITKNKVRFTGFIYDSIIANASVTAYYKDEIIGTTDADPRGKWKMDLNIIDYGDEDLIVFEAVKPTKKVKFRSIISTVEIGKRTKKLNVNDDLNLIISNVTTAKYAITEKILNKGSATWTATELIAAEDKISTDFEGELLIVSAAIKAVVDGNKSTEMATDTLALAKDIIKENNETTIEVNLTAYPDVEDNIPTQIAAIDKDEVLSEQLKNAEDVDLSTAGDIQTLLTEGDGFFDFELRSWYGTIGAWSSEVNGNTITWKEQIADIYTNSYLDYGDFNGTHVVWVNGSWVSALEDINEIDYSSDGLYLNIYADKANNVIQEKASIINVTTNFGSTMDIKLQMNGEYIPVSIPTPDGAEEYTINVERPSPFFTLDDTVGNYEISGNEYNSITELYDAISTASSEIVFQSRYPDDDILLGIGSNAGKMMVGGQTVGYYLKVEADNNEAPAYIDFQFNSKAKEYELTGYANIDDSKIWILDNKIAKYAHKGNAYKIYTYNKVVKDSLLTTLEKEAIDVAVPTVKYWTSYDQNETCSVVSVADGYHLFLTDATNMDNHVLVPLGSDGQPLVTTAKALKLLFPNGFTQSEEEWNAYSIFKPGSYDEYGISVSRSADGVANVYGCNIPEQ